MFNPRPLISARVLDRNAAAEINSDWLAARFADASALRDRMFEQPYYRLVHAEADGLPGLIVDRYGDTCVVQLNTAGMNLLAKEIVTALQQTLSPSGIVLQRDGSARRMEGLDDVAPSHRRLPIPARVLKTALNFWPTCRRGRKRAGSLIVEKTRARRVPIGRTTCARRLQLSRRFRADSCRSRRIGRPVHRPIWACLKSPPARPKAGYASICRFEKSEAFSALETIDGRETLANIADPPAFVKSRKDLKPGARGYRSRPAVFDARGTRGILCIARSHHMGAASFAEQVQRGMRDSGRSGRILHSSGAGPDHPVHPNCRKVPT